MNQNTRRAAALAVVFVVLLSSVGGASATTGEFQTATTGDTVVVAVGGSTAFQQGNAIALAKNHSVVNVPESGLTVPAKQYLTERSENGDLQNVKVIGTNISTVVDELDEIEGLRLTEQIGAESPGELSWRVAIRESDLSDTAFVTTSNDTDLRKTAVALSNDSVNGPVLYESAGHDDINSTLQNLQVSTVYVTPAVSNETVAFLNGTYTVETAPEGVALNQSLQEVAGGYASSSEDFVVTHPTDVLSSAQAGVGTNSSILVTENESAVGQPVKTHLNNASNNTNVWAVGDQVPLADVASHSPTTPTHLEYHPTLRTSLLVADYDLGLLVTELSHEGAEYDVTIRNIGFGTIPDANNGDSVIATWHGEIEESTPEGNQTDDGYVVAYSEPIEPGESWTVELYIDRAENGGYPELDYFAQAPDGSLIPSTDTDISLPLVDNTVPLWMVIVGGASLFIVAVWVTNRTIRTASSGSSRSRNRFRASLGLGQYLDKWVLLRIAIILTAIPVFLIAVAAPPPGVDEAAVVVVTAVLQLALPK